jgi:TPR repeat protein
MVKTTFRWIAIAAIFTLFWPRQAAFADDATQAVYEAVAAYNTGKFAKAFELLTQEARKGSSDAQVNLGYMYARGQAVSADQAKALALYLQSAKQGNGEGMNAAGYKYAFGSGVKPDLKEAIRWFCEAIRKGNPRAMNNLGLLLDEGKGVPRDLNEARSLWRQSADRDDPNGMFNLARSLLNERNDTDAMSEGFAWLKTAAMRGQGSAQNVLKKLNYEGALPPPTDQAATMTIQTAIRSPGHAGICGG